MKPYDLSVVMPVYNEAEAIGPVLKKWMAMLDTLGIRYRIRAYNDGSKDATGKILAEVADASGGRVLAVDKPNSGHGPTILRGYREAAEDSDWVFQIDSDDEMGPESFPELWAKRNDYDFLVGRRDGRRQPLARKVVSFVSRLCVRLFYGKGIWDVNTPYRLMRAEVFAPFYAQIPDDTFAPNVILSGLAARHHLRLLEIPVPQHDRTTGEVSIKKWKLLKAAARSFAQTIAFSLPAGEYPTNRFNALVTFGCATLGVLFCLFVIIGLGWEIMVPVSLITMLVLLRLRGGKWVPWLGRHTIFALLTVIALGVLCRIGMLITFPEFLQPEKQIAETGFFRGCIDALLNGEFVTTKSWCTVIYYTAIAQLFGNTMLTLVGGSLLLSSISTVLAFLLGRRWTGDFGGVIFAACVAFSPFLVLQTKYIVAEHVYAPLLLLSLFLASLAYDAKNTKKIVGYGILFGVSAWLTIWTRGEGILLWVLVPGLFIGAKLMGLLQWRKMLPFLAVAIVMFTAGAGVGYAINQRLDGAKTIFCSNDSLIPRLVGTSERTWGVWDNALVEEAEATYKQSRGLPDNYEIPWGCVQEDYANFLKETTANRWESLSFTRKARLIWKKAQITWHPPRESLKSTANIMANLALSGFMTFTALVSLIVFALILLRRRMLSPFFLWSGLLFVIGNAALLCISEAAWRYSMAFHLLFGMYVALAMTWFLQPKTLRDKQQMKHNY